MTQKGTNNWYQSFGTPDPHTTDMLIGMHDAEFPR
jgi:hypothetical protein